MQPTNKLTVHWSNQIKMQYITLGKKANPIKTQEQSLGTKKESSKLELSIHTRKLILKFVRMVNRTDKREELISCATSNFCLLLC